jgi:hypothetical protein
MTNPFWRTHEKRLKNQAHMPIRIMRAEHYTGIIPACQPVPAIVDLKNNRNLYA